MNTLMIAPRSAVTLALASLVTGAAFAADPQVTEHVIVEAGRPTTNVVGQSDLGAPIEKVQLRGHVLYSDLELSIPSNVKVLKQRVHDAARELCARLDQMYPVSSSDDCPRKAVEGAMPQVTAAIAEAEARKSAAR